jgi:hypothetical protein
MSKTKVIFHSIVEYSHDATREYHYKLSRVYYSLDIDGRQIDGLFSDVRQKTGNGSETLEVAPPPAYRGELDREALCRAVREYLKNIARLEKEKVEIPSYSTIPASSETIKHEMVVDL